MTHFIIYESQYESYDESHLYIKLTQMMNLVFSTSTFSSRSFSTGLELYY